MKNQKSSMPAKIVFVFIVTAVLIIVFGTVYYFVEKSISETDVKNQLSSIGKLKTEEIERWRSERIGDAHVISQNTDFIITYKEFLDRINYERNKENLKARVEALGYYKQYDNMLLLGFDNDVKYSSKDKDQTLSKHTLDLISAAKLKSEITMSDFYRNEKNSKIYIDIVAPVFFENKYLGCLVLIINPDMYLYSMIQNWPYQTETGENLLFKVENNEIVYLNEIRFAKNTALKFKIPINQSNEKILSVQAANGKLGILDGVDYLKNNVLGYVSKIENTNWILVTKINSSEAFAKSGQKSLYTILLLIFIVFIISGAFYLFWRDRQKQAQEVINQNRNQTQYNRSLIEASIDPLVTINPDGKITDVNEATVRATGLPRESLINTEFHEYFTEPEKAREGYLKVFNEGFVRDYPLVIRNISGKQTPVLYNASTYKDVDGKVIGVFAAARDVTELERAKELSAQQDWLKTGIASLNDVMRGNLKLSDFGNNVIKEVSNYLDAKIGVFYAAANYLDMDVYSIIGSYAYMNNDNHPQIFRTGEGIVGQVALEKKPYILNDIPDDYLKITSGIGETLPKSVCIAPVIYEGITTGVIEIGLLEELTPIKKQYLAEASRLISITMAAVLVREKLDLEFKRSQELTEELQRQQEELKASNEELEEQTMLLKQSEEKLKSQQEELRVSNEELEARNDALEVQKKEIEKARNDLNIKAEELALASKYKSEFLANMSHELRTPLNSLLILSKMLCDNREGNLKKDQIESAEIIYNSGNDLLHLINEILDLSKIEAGRMDIHSENVHLTELVENIRNNFRHVAEEKGLQLIINVEKDAPEFIKSDRKRIDQILKNLISNAIKFTKTGEVRLTFKLNKASENNKSNFSPDGALSIEVSDTGIGISKEKQKIIFQAFHQEEGGTSREFGGTGLGLSISKELATLLGGEITLKSEKGKGATFTLILPLELKLKDKTEEKKTADKSKTVIPEDYNGIPHTGETIDDRDIISEGERNILVIEDNLNFAKLLYKECNRKGFKGLIALDGEEGLKLASRFRPSAIILDIKLPGMDGYQVLESLKENSKLRHIPVHIMSSDDSTIEAFKKGAIGFLTKPPQREQLEEAFNKLIDYSSRNMKNLLVAEDDDNLRSSIVKLIGNGDVKTTAVSSGKEVVHELENKNYDCMIMDIGLSDISGFELLKTLEAKQIKIPPVIVYTGKDLTRKEEEELRNYAESIIIKGVRSEERLLDEASLFLHRVVENMPTQKRKMIINLHETDEMFRDKKLLLADDDMRNMFALSKILGQKGFKLYKAENGIKALEVLEKEPDIDLILMDIMMPEMDGYETMKRIRAQEKFFNTPIIALTAKAMKKDYAKCIEAGANDYMPKPIDVDRLCSMLRVWLYR